MKNIINIVTFNVRILNTINQLLELIVFAAEYNIDIICVQEYRYYHSEQELKYQDASYGWTFGKTLSMSP